MLHFKRKNICGQQDGVRSRTVIGRVHGKALKSATKYRVARAALFALRGGGSWEEQFRELADGDVRLYVDPAQISIGPGRRGTVEQDTERAPEEFVDEQDGNDELGFFAEQTQRDGTGESRKELSWIWRTTAINIDDMNDDNDDILRAEWCQSRARSRRAKEQVEKTKEEMRRTLGFLKWRAEEWSKWGQMGSDAQEVALHKGLAAYAARQGLLQTQLSAAFEAQWKQPVAQWEEDSLRDQDNNNNDDEDSLGWDQIEGMDDEDSDTEVRTG